MLNETVRKRFSDLYETKLSEREKQFPLEISSIDRQASARGVFNSSVRLLQLHRAHEGELGIRAILAWESLVRVHRALGCPSSADLRNEMKMEISKAIEEQSSVLGESLSAKTSKGSIQIPMSLDLAKESALKKHEVEIDLYVDSLTLSGQEGQHPMTQTYNFYGAVGAVQSGSGAAANVVQNLGAKEKEDLAKAIEGLREAISSSPTLSERQRIELLEIASDCSSQISASAPNGTKLLTMLNVLGLSVQSIASAQPAYQAFKVAALALGVSLP